MLLSNLRNTFYTLNISVFYCLFILKDIYIYIYYIYDFIYRMHMLYVYQHKTNEYMNTYRKYDANIYHLYITI